MNDHRTLRVCTRVALGVAAVLPFAAACGGSSPPPATASGAATTGMGQTPPPAYGGAPPPGYPGTPPPGYPGAAPTAYPPQAQGQPQYPPPAGQPNYPPPANQPPGTAPAPTQAPPGPLAPTDPNSLQGILNGIQTALQGTVVPGGATSGDLTDAGLKLLAVRVASGMQPEGDELKQTLTEGQHAVMMVTLQAGKCYSIVGFSPPGAIKDLDLNLLAPPLYMTLAGQDLTHNNTPTIGGAPNPMCPVIAFPLQYKLDVFAKSGSGQVAVQLYSKTKA
jgi:hypothetical protein